MPFQVSRSAWSVIGWVTISHPKINSEISKILAPNFRDFQNFEKSKFPKIPKFPKSSPLCFGKSRPLSLGILEISEFLEILEFLEMLEILDFF